MSSQTATGLHLFCALLQLCAFIGYLSVCVIGAKLIRLQAERNSASTYSVTGEAEYLWDYACDASTLTLYRRNEAV
jgi:hypothetical protein